LKEAGSSLRDGQAYSVDGQRPESNNFLIDGANNVNAVDAASSKAIPRSTPRDNPPKTT
jgi:hypothetical protein